MLRGSLDPIPWLLFMQSYISGGDRELLPYLGEPVSKFLMPSTVKLNIVVCKYTSLPISENQEEGWLMWRDFLASQGRRKK